MKYGLILSSKELRNLASMPFIYLFIFPVVVLDLCLEIYHRVCFPLYGISFVERGRYIKIDRHKLSYLGPLQKVNCMYCGYVNGFFAYGVKVAGETEKYWCAIQHEKDPNFIPPDHHKDFPAYGNKKEFRKIKKEVY